MINKKIVLTGSHLTPALALEAKLKSKGWEVVYLIIKSPKFSRHQPIISSLSLIKLPFSLFQALKRLSSIKPKLVVSFGGYAALPVCLAAKLLRLPLIIHEQTLASGLTSKITALIADKVAISWPSSRAFFPQKKIVLVGNPIRQEILAVKSLKTKSHSRPIIYITGGHQGSKIINAAVAEILPRLLEKFTVYHQFGLAQSDLALKNQSGFKHPRYILKRWFSGKELAAILYRTALAVSRSGINTTTELAYLHLPAVLIPLTTAQKNEQITNAQFLKSLGLALILPQSKLNPANLLQAINRGLKQLPQTASSKFDSRLIYSAADNLYQLIDKFSS